MDDHPTGGLPSAGGPQKDSRAGQVSLAIFALTATVEIIFISIALFIVSAVPPGGDQTFPFEAKVGMALFFGQFFHVGGILVALFGIFGRKRKRLAILGMATNFLLALLFWIG